MSKVTYDLRPVDTENVIQTRNRIRLSSFLNIFGVLLYLTINASLVQTHASWIHLIHMLSEPYIIFTTVADNSGFAGIRNRYNSNRHGHSWIEFHIGYKMFW